MFYVRYRWGHLSVRVSLYPTKDIGEAVGGKEVLAVNIGDGFDGVLSECEMKARACSVLRFE